MDIQTRPLDPEWQQKWQAAADPAGQTLPLPILQKIYTSRGVTNTHGLMRDLKALLSPLDLPDIEKAGQRLADAIIANERIVIVGDFDADGATSVALCMLVLRDMGAVNVDYLVPNRFEYGYGLSPEIVELAQRQSPDLIVTVDNGVSSVAGVERAQQAGIDVIVTDHHLPGQELPPAYAMVNPNLIDSHFASGHMAGVGVAYYVLSQVRSELRKRAWFDVEADVQASNPPRTEPNMANYLDLVALGTVADVVPLDANNRVLVHQGIRRMRAGRCQPGIKALAEIAKRPLEKMSAQDLGFALGPRLNAAGRLEDMSIGIKCLLATELREARSLATALDQLNQTRRQLEQDMVGDAELLLAEGQADADAVGLTVYHETFHQGVVGIVAGRLKEKHHKPVIAFADAGDAAPDELKGSARSIAGLHIRDVLDHIATTHPGLLIKFGGHAMAAGLSIKRVHYPRFQVIFDKAVRQIASADVLAMRIVTDGVLQPHEINLDTAQAIANGGPWGNGFPEPLFYGEFDIVNQRVVGEQHLKLLLRSGVQNPSSGDEHQPAGMTKSSTRPTVVDAIAFRQPPIEMGTSTTGKVRVVYKLSVNDWGDRNTVQLMVEYLEPLP